MTGGSDRDEAAGGYLLEEQVGFVLRVASQRHTAIFARHMIEGLTATQFAAVARLAERGPQPQNELGRLTAMDVATIKGVVDRLRVRGLVASRRDPHDGRKMVIDLTDDGRRAFSRAVDRARRITEETLQPLDAGERETLLKLLRRIA